jgi:ferredoxin
MTRVRIQPTNVSVELRPGERLLDVLDELEDGGVIPVHCRGGNCGSCVVGLGVGIKSWRAAAVRELEALLQLGAAEGERLGCQLVLERAADVELAIECAPVKKVTG